MLSERIATLYELLQCNNTDIARFAGCSSGNISRLKTGNRTPRPSSRSIAALAEGVYGYADYENLLTALQELCGAEDTTRGKLIPSLISWLYESEDVTLPSRPIVPKSKQAKALQRQSFGAKLVRAMSLLELSKRQLATLLSIDVSLVSRYCSGIYTPIGNEKLSEKLSGILLARAEKSGKTETFAELCSVSTAELDMDAVAAWLYQSPAEEDKTAMGHLLLRSLDNFVPGQGLPATMPEMPEIAVASRYQGTDGLRSAVVRFLSDAAREGGELLLYSDEPMEWMSGDREFFALWASLMINCVKNGVQIKIIHNVDRGGAEMIDAIKGWLPLYISGMIEPYVFHKNRNARFCHTVFLRSGGACIHGFFPAGSGEKRWYEYITDEERLALLHHEYNAMLSSASPFLKTYPSSMGEEYRALRLNMQKTQSYLVTAFPVATMPEPLLADMLSRANVGEAKKAETVALYHSLRDHFFRMLSKDSVNLILCLPGTAYERRVNFSLDLADVSIDYTPEEFAEHTAAIAELVRKERNFHLTLLPDAPFRDIQIVTMQDAIAVLRCREPYAAFVFLNPALTQSVSDYLSALIVQNAEDRSTMIGMLERLAKTGK